MRPHTDAGFGAISDERGAYLPAERPSAASSAARLAATQQQRCRASTAPASQRRPRHPPSRARQGATVDARRLKAATCVPLFFFPTHPPCLCGGVSGLRSGVDVISDARAAAAQHKQWRAQQTGGGIASRQQLHARTNGGNGRARIHSSCSSGGGGGSYSCHRPPHHWRRGAARSASRLTPAFLNICI